MNQQHVVMVQQWDLALVPCQEPFSAIWAVCSQKKLRLLTPTQATQRPPRTGLTEGSALLYCQIMYPLFFSLALKIPFASVSLLNTLQPPQFLISPKHSEFHPNTANPRAPTQAATPKPRSSPALTHSPQKVLLTPLP